MIAEAQIDLVIAFETDSDVRLLLSALPHSGQIVQQDSLVHVYTHSEQTLTDLVLALHEAQVAYRKITITYPQLEEAFLKLVNPAQKGAVS